jgi:hypothetical protein
MKQLYKTLQNAIENRPHFKFKYLTLKCPHFIAKVFLGDQHTTLTETRHWWDNYPEVDSVQYDSNNINYLPKYE